MLRVWHYGCSLPLCTRPADTPTGRCRAARGGPLRLLRELTTVDRCHHHRSLAGHRICRRPCRMDIFAVTHSLILPRHPYRPRLGSVCSARNRHLLPGPATGKIYFATMARVRDPVSKALFSQDLAGTQVIRRRRGPGQIPLVGNKVLAGMSMTDFLHPHRVVTGISASSLSGNLTCNRAPGSPVAALVFWIPDSIRIRDQFGVHLVYIRVAHLPMPQRRLL